MSFEEFMVRWIFEQVLFTMGGVIVMAVAAVFFTLCMHLVPKLWDVES